MYYNNNDGTQVHATIAKEEKSKQCLKLESVWKCFANEMALVE